MRARIQAVLLGSFVASCTTSGEDTSASDSFGSGGSTSSSAEASTSTMSTASGVTSAGTSSSGGRDGTTSTGEVSTEGGPIFDVATELDVPPVVKECPEGMFDATDQDACAIDPVVYARDDSFLTLTIVLGQLFEITDPAVEVIFATDQVGYEGFFTVAREMAAPDVFYMIVSDDDFMQAAVNGECGVELMCETTCIAGPGGDVCRAFVDDFIPIVAAAYVGAPFSVDTFGRRSSPAGDCCVEDFTCNYTVSTYTEYVVSGPGGTMHFIFQDGFAFLDTMGWNYTERKTVTGDAQFEFDLCSLPVPEG